MLKHHRRVQIPHSTPQVSTVDRGLMRLFHIDEAETDRTAYASHEDVRKSVCVRARSGDRCCKDEWAEPRRAAVGELVQREESGLRSQGTFDVGCLAQGVS